MQHQRPPKAALRYTPVRCTPMMYTPMRCMPMRCMPITYTPVVARSRQVCIYWLWKHCLLLSILPGGRTNTYRHKKTLFGRLLYDAHSLYESGTPSIRYFQSIVEDSTSGRGISGLST